MASSDQLEKYLNYIGRFPVLTRDQERQLALRHRAGDEKAGRKLVNSNLRFVVSIVTKKYGRSGLPLMDLIQEGNVGLMRAVVKFDPRRKLRLATYAIHWVNALIGRYIQRQRSLVQTSQPIGRDASLNMPAFGDDANDDTFLDLLTDGLRVDDIYIDKEAATNAKERILRALCKVKPDERLVITQRNLGKERATLEEVGRILGVSRERVRQIEMKAMKKLENILTFDGLPE